MLDLNELYQLVLFAEKGTLTDVAEICHISTPSVTRSMKHLEDAFGVSLFSRGKNKIELNETGLAAVEAAKKILAEHDRQLLHVQTFDQNRKTISILSCAPAPLWDLIPKLSAAFPGKIVSSQLKTVQEIIDAYEKMDCSYAILPYAYQDFKPIMTEKLFVSVKKGHEFAKLKSISFQELNGFNFLIRSEIGFWDKLCRDKMPASRFLVQSDEFEFNELIATSSLPCFATDVGIAHGIIYEDRVSIPIRDAEATETFYMNQITR